MSGDLFYATGNRGQSTDLSNISNNCALTPVFKCEVDCIEDFVAPGASELAKNVLNETAKRVREETLKMAIKAGAKRVNIVVTVYEGGKMIKCFVDCDEEEKDKEEKDIKQGCPSARR